MAIPPDAFAPHISLAAALIGRVDNDDGAHDLAHVLRVWRNAGRIATGEGLSGEAGVPEGSWGEMLAAAVLLHDCVAVEKSSPLRAQASRLAATRAGEILAGMSWTSTRIAEVVHAIAAHSFSAGMIPQNDLARVLQDADRLDALGYIGIARCFYTAGRMGSALYHPSDLAATHRSLEDSRYALDHFRAKLLRLGEGFQTQTGARLAAGRLRVITEFMNGMEDELS